jgi:aminoglycoside phosphotransferase (APT) family kinase protein
LAGYRLLEALWNAGFQSDSADGISVPEPIGTVAQFQMWLQRKVGGCVATDLLSETTPVSLELPQRIADAAHKLHGAGVPAERRHTMADELRILHQHLPTVAPAAPRWSSRIQRLLEACDRLGAATPEPAPRGIHRDFYPDQVIVAPGAEQGGAGPIPVRLHLIDFDLYCEGDPGLDIGNFLGHITEQSLRSLGDPEALADRERALEDWFVELSGEVTRAAVKAYAALTLVRHIYLSTLFPERRPFTAPLLELCEERLGALEHAYP